MMTMTPKGAVIIWIGLAFIGLAFIWGAIPPSTAEGTHRGLDMKPMINKNYHMMVILDQVVSDIPDRTKEECVNSAAILKLEKPEARVCCYHTAEDGAGCWK